jgi:hypothetical protein
MTYTRNFWKKPLSQLLDRKPDEDAGAAGEDVIKLENADEPRLIDHIGIAEERGQ